MDKISIGEKAYRVEVNWRTLVSFLSIKETDSMECLEKMSLQDWVSMMGAAVIEGERLEGNDVSSTIAEEIFAMRPAELIGAVKVFVKIYNEQSAPKIPEKKA